MRLNGPSNGVRQVLQRGDLGIRAESRAMRRQIRTVGSVPATKARQPSASDAGVAARAIPTHQAHRTGSDPAPEIDLIEGLGRRYADGLILSPLRITDDHLRALRAAQVPIVIIGSLPEDEPLDSVRADSRRGVGLAIEHLFAAGRRSIGFVNGDPRTVPGTARQEGYRAALAAAGLKHDERLEINGGEFTYAAGFGAARRLLARTRPDALFCADDLIAGGAMPPP